MADNKRYLTAEAGLTAPGEQVLELHDPEMDRLWPIVRLFLAGWRETDGPDAEWTGQKGQPVTADPSREPADRAIAMVNQIMDLVRDSREARICLHAGGVITGTGAALLFCGPGYSGKSTLAAIMSSSGHLITGDDRVFLDDDETGLIAVAAGLARKVRVPLPRDISPAVRTAIDKQMTPLPPALPPGMRFLAHDPLRVAAPGRLFPVSRILLLNRVPDQPIEFEDVTTGEAVRFLAEQSDIAGDRLPELINRLKGICNSHPVKRVTFSSSEELGTLLAEKWL